MAENEPSGSTGSHPSKWSTVSILTTSFRANAEQFGEQIDALEATKSNRDEIERNTDQFEKYGIEWTDHRVRAGDLHYRANRTHARGEPIVTNALDEDGVDELLTHADEFLKTYEDENGNELPPDLVVGEMKLLVTSDVLQNYTGADTNRFTLHFESEQAEDSLTSATRKADQGIGLLERVRQHRNLNLHEVSAKAGTESSHDEISLFAWGGKDDVNPIADDGLIQTIRDHVLPDEEFFVVTKEFTRESENRAGLVSSSAEDEA